MVASNTSSTTEVNQSVDDASALSGIYFGLISLLLASIAIKCQGSSPNPFQEPSATMLLFLFATSCHAIALEARSTRHARSLFHVSGITACEALVWVLVAELLWCILINVLMLLVILLIFHHKYICEHLLMCLEWIPGAGKTLLQSGQYVDQDAHQMTGKKRC